MSTYRFIKGLGGQPGQNEIEKEYWRQRKSLLEDIRKYKNRDIKLQEKFEVGPDKKKIQVDIKVPEIPKNITEGSIRVLEKEHNHLRYITDRELRASVTDPEHKYVPRDEKWEKIEGYNVRIQNAKYLQAQALSRKQEIELAQKRAEIERQNLDNAFWEAAQLEGYKWEDLPSDTENYALKLMMIAADALSPEDSTAKKYRSQTKRKYNRTKAYSFNANQKALFSVVKKKAQLAYQQFQNMGIGDPNLPEKNKQYSKNLEQDFAKIAKRFEEWLWESDQYSNPVMTGLEMAMIALNRTQRQSGAQKRKQANEIEEESI